MGPKNMAVVYMPMFFSRSFVVSINHIFLKATFIFKNLCYKYISKRKEKRSVKYVKMSFDNIQNLMQAKYVLVK